MQVHTFRADSLQAALQQVRQTLGPDASVLQTRECRQGRFGIFSRTFIEVEATLDVPVASRFLTESKSDNWPTSARHTVTSPSTPIPALSRPRMDSAEVVAASQSSAENDRQRDNAGGHLAAGSLLTSSSTVSTLSQAMLETLSELLEGGVDPRLARALLKEVGDGCDEEQLHDPWFVRARLYQTVAGRLSVSGSIDLQPGKQQVVAMVGPTGVGKTTTLAKIAAGFRFDLGCQIGLITLDTFRLGAVDQLLQYAELISAPLEVVSSPDQVTAALHRLRACDLVLLDTAGRSPRDHEQLSVLLEFLRCAKPHSTQLVVSATSSAACVQETIEQFSRLQPTNLLITKLDESVNFGAWLSILEAGTLPISYLTTGQHVPQDIVVASTRRLAGLLLGNIRPSKGAPDPSSKASDRLGPREMQVT